MSFDFNAEEVFEIAEQIERNGSEFYRKAADNMSGPKEKEFLIHLAEMEDEHEKTFKKMRAELTQDEKVMTTFDPDGYAEKYLKALADTRVFYEKEIDTNSMEEIFKAAITAEKDSIVFYLGIKEIVPEHLGKSKLDEIIREEMDHIRTISKHLIELKS